MKESKEDITSPTAFVIRPAKNPVDNANLPFSS